MGSISLWNLLRFVILAAVLFMVLLTLYYLVPNRLYTVRQVMPGTFASLLSWLVFSIGFAFYVENMGRNNFNPDSFVFLGAQINCSGVQTITPF